MQHAVDMHRLYRSTLQRRQQDAAQGVAERLAEATLERLCDQGRKAVRIGSRRHLELVGTDKFLPIFLDRHCFTHTGQSICHLNYWRWRPADQSAACKISSNRFAGRGKAAPAIVA